MSAKKDFARALLGRLWDEYARRVPYARTYQSMLDELEGVLVCDHVAFRSLRLPGGDGRETGIGALAPAWVALGFEERGTLEAPEHGVMARYYRHEEPDFPKVLISELVVEALVEPLRGRVVEAVAGATGGVAAEDLEALSGLDKTGRPPEGLLERVAACFKGRPWGPPPEDVVAMAEEASPYVAWSLLFGYQVNHFSGYVNRHGVEGVDELDKLIGELRKRGVPMREEVEGEAGGILRQASTRAVRVPVAARGADGAEKALEWAYANVEFTQRGETMEDGHRRLFQGFLPSEAVAAAR